jgi:hypothetical protein
VSEEFLEREVLSRVNMDRRAFVKKFIVGAAFAVPAVASFEMLASSKGYGALTPNGANRRQIICQDKDSIRAALQSSYDNLSADAPAALKKQLLSQINKLNAYITAHC